ncbi:sulfotransferase [Rubrobacter taiwanensis]|jgi:hypothetical protein|uniref:Sulfotransferase n=1 Tax=Rubrobacter taiwanensis TaxID=185139 RepID=A0A4R1BED2_9ACTN|nr:sulfotransferase [Rubrobacter taiwanensis]TCJ15470.1 sulfotransferase [Rubrobacter taiwanensis]
MGERTLEELSPCVHDSHRVKVLYIAGWGRSGSTILGRILGQVEGFSPVGELRYIWERGVIEDRLCSCGALFSGCPVWQEILARTFGSTGNVDAERLAATAERGLRTRHLVLWPGQRPLQARLARLGEYLKTLGRLYRSVQEVTGSRVIVDTSKFPSYAYLLQHTPGIELYVLHLVRDPRAVAYSWETRRKHRGEGSDGFMTPHGSVESSLVWSEWNLAIESVWKRRRKRYMLLRYEDFVEAPQSSLRDILRFAGEGTAELFFEDERRASLETSHIFSGNPDRFLSGTVTIKRDDGWKRDMKAAKQAMVTSLTWPGLIHYGYSLRPQRDLLRR